MKALVLVADGSEEVEAVTGVTMLRRAAIEVAVVAVKAGGATEIVGSRGVRLLADENIAGLAAATAATAAAFDAILLPGGLGGAETFSKDARVQELLRAFEGQGKLVAAICASTTALHAAGIGRGKRATSYPSFRPQLEAHYDYQETAVAVDRGLITSRGPGTAMAWTLAVIEALCGAETRQSVAEDTLTAA